MKQAALLTTLMIVSCVSFARPRGASNYNSSYFTDSSTIKHSVVHVMLTNIIQATGLEMDIELREADVLNIEASVTRGRKYILYNEDYLSSLLTLSKDRWTVIALLAHEVGHHIKSHTNRRGGSKPALELEADEFAGFILHKLGGTLEQSQHVMHFIARVKGSKTHPPRASRLLAVERGWNKAVDDGNLAAGK